MALLNFNGLVLDWNFALDIALEIFFALGGAAIIVAAYRRIYKFYKNNVSVARLHRVLVRKYTLFDMMQEMLNYVGGNRLLLLRLENGGNVPEVTKPLYVTVIEETYNNPVSAIKSRWQHRLVDIPYIKMLVKMGRGSITVDTENLEDECILKNAYKSAGIQRACICYVSTTKHYMYFVSIGFLDKKILSEQAKDRISSFLDGVREII